MFHVVLFLPHPRDVISRTDGETTHTRWFDDQRSKCLSPLGMCYSVRSLYGGVAQRSNGLNVGAATRYACCETVRSLRRATRLNVGGDFLLSSLLTRHHFRVAHNS